MALAPDPNYLLGPASFALGALLLWRGAHHGPSRVLAYFLLLIGFEVVPFMWMSFGDPQGWPFVGAAAGVMGTYAHLARIVVGLWFFAIYPRVRRGVPKPPYTGLPFLALIGLLWAWFALDHGAWIDWARSQDLPLGPYAPPGPLLFLNDAIEALAPWLVLLLLRDYARTEAGPGRTQLLLVAAAFSFGFLALGSVRLLQVALVGEIYLMAPDAEGEAFGAWSLAWFAFTLAGAAAVLATAARIATRAPDADQRAGGRRYLHFAAGVVAFHLAVAALPGATWDWSLGPRAPSDAVLFLTGLWPFAAYTTLTYALLRHRLFGLDLRLKRTIKGSTVATAFVGLFLLGSEGARALGASGVAPLLGLGAAAALLLGFARVQRLADGVAERALPGVSAEPAYLDQRRLDVYRAALEESRGPDGSVAHAQAAVLERLRAELGLSERDAALLDYAVRRPQAQAALRPGDVVLGRYRVARALGEGSFGRAFVAEDQAVGRRVVLKAVPAGEGMEAVLREARAVGAVQHPHVITLHDVARAGGEAYIVMEHAEGGSLAERLERGPLGREEFARVALGTLRGLEAIHAAGIVHRDVKPSNVLLTRGGEAKLADFGVAHLPGFGTTAGPGTAQGAVGTARYMSPEQAKGRRVDARSDLYGAAATLLEAWTGQPWLAPRPGESAVEVQMRAARGRKFDMDVEPASLRAWFARALAPRPQDRFRDAAAMREALERALTARGR